jgi:hypothetical protein
MIGRGWARAVSSMNYLDTAEWSCCEEGDNLRGQKSLGPLKMSLEMAHKVILPPKKNYIPQFLKQRDINSYNAGLLLPARKP